MQHISEIPPISDLANIEGGKLFEKIQNMFSEKKCPLVGRDGANVHLLFIAARLIKKGEIISQEKICANCKYQTPCIAQKN